MNENSKATRDTSPPLLDALAQPVVLTTFRLLIGPIVVLLYLAWGDSLVGRLIAASLFGVGGFTDWYDGYRARQMNVTSTLGSVLDPVADKALVCCTLFALVYGLANWWMTIAAVALMFRELTVSGLREYAALKGGFHVAVSQVGKYKTAAQMTALPVLLVADPDGGFLIVIGFLCLLIAIPLSLMSGIGYFRGAVASMSQPPS